MPFPPYTKTYHTSAYAALDTSRPELSTAGKVVLITGGGSGIGQRIAHAYASSGATKISILGRTASSLLATKQEIEAAHKGVTVHTATADIVDTSAVNEALAGTEKALGKIDILISNAAYMPDLGPIATANVDDWFKGFETNVKAPVMLAQAFLKHSSANPTLIHLSSAVAHIAVMPGGMSAYTTSKLASMKLMDHIAFENPHVRVHTIHPGVIKTDMDTKLAAVGLVLPFDDIELPARFAVWIASPEAEHLRGKFVWSNWDVEELITRKEEYLTSPALTIGLLGWP